MNRHHPISALALGTAIAGTALTGCSGGSDAADEAPARPAVGALSTTPDAPAPAAPVATAPVPIGSAEIPSAPAQVPPGTYRVTITRDELIAAGDPDLGMAGTWTLKITSEENFRLDCAAVHDPGQDCGTSTNTPVEVGMLRGAGNEMWIVHDEARLVAASGCTPGDPGPDGCGPQGAYRLTWQPVSDGLRFAAEPGSWGAAASWQLKPWQKIG